MKTLSFIFWLFTVGLLYAQDATLDPVKAKIEAKDYSGAMRS